MLRILQEGNVYEVRILDLPRNKKVAGYFNDFKEMYKAIANYDGKGNIYVTLNPCNPALLARGENKLVEYPKAATGDGDILHRHWLLIDVDPVRPAQISASNEEKEAAKKRAIEIHTYLRAQGWPDPITADSGNGYHMFYRTEQPNNEESRVLYKNCLLALALRFDDKAVNVDTSVFNASRIVKLHGTMAVKGDNTEDRPHRRSTILKATDNLQVVPLDKLQALASQVPKEQTQARGHGDTFNIDEWLIQHNVPVGSPMAWNGGRKWVFDVCPFNSSHTNRSSFIVQFSSGAIAGGCHHNGCQGKGWHSLRDLFEPGWRQARETFRLPGDQKPVPQKSDKPEEKKVIDFSTLFRKPNNGPAVEIPMIVPKTLPRGYVTTIIGDPKSGKTWLSMRLACDISVGGRILDGFAFVQPAKVLYLMGDTGPQLVDYRLNKSRWRYDDEMLNFIYAEDLRKQGIDMDLGTVEGMGSLQLLISHWKPDVLFIDTLTSFHWADESDNKTMKPLIAGLSDLAATWNMAIVALHHTRKKKRAEYGMTMTQHDSVGAGVLSRLVGNIIGVELKESETEGKRFIVKPLASWFKEFNQFSFSLENVEDDLRRDWIEMKMDLCPGLDESAEEKVWRVITSEYWDGRPFRRNEIQKLTGLSHDPVSQILNRLAGKGKLTSSGQTSSKIFKLPVEVTKGGVM